MARLKLPPGARVSRKTAPSLSYSYRPEDDESDASSAVVGREASEAEDGTGCVEHLGSDLSDAVMSEALVMTSPPPHHFMATPMRPVSRKNSTRRNRDMRLNSSDDPSRQLLHEAAAQPPSMRRSPRSGQPSKSDSTTRGNNPALFSPSEFVKPMAGELESRVSTGKLKRPWKSVTSSRKHLRLVDGEARQNPPSQQFREEDWDLQDGDTEVATTSIQRSKESSLGRAKPHAKQGRAVDPILRRKRGRPPKASVADQVHEEQGHDLGRDAASQAQHDESEEEQPLQSPQSHMAQNTGLNDDVRPEAPNKRPAASKKVETMQRHGHQRPLKGRHGNVFEGNEDMQDGSNLERIRVTANMPKLQPKERRRHNTIEGSHLPKPSAVASGGNVRIPNQRRKRGEEREDDTVYELFTQGRSQSSHDERSDVDEDEEEESVDQIDFEDRPRFFGQFELLRYLEMAVGKPGSRRRPVTKSLRLLHQLCRKVNEDLQTIRESKGDEDEHPQYETDLAEKVTRLQRLTSKLNADTSGDGQVYAYEIYQSIFRGLTRVFIALCYFFESHGGLGLDALKTLIGLADTILDLRQRAVKWRTKPDPRTKMVRPVVNDIIAPLQRVYTVFRNQEDQLQRIKQLHRKQLASQEFYREQQRKEELYEQQVAAEHDKIPRLQELYLTRQEVEPDRKRRAQLGLPQKCQSHASRRFDIDANGSASASMNLSGSRNAGLRHQLSGLAPAVWTTEQRLDFMEGLEQFGGSHSAFSDIIRTYCGPRGSLRDFQVHQLLEEAAGLREDLLRAEERDYTIQVPDSIKGLPDMDLLDYLVKRCSYTTE